MGRAGHRGEGQRVFETVLVADRGLLAVRVIRSCQRLGIKAVSCVAEGDEHALHALVADEVIALGPAADQLSRNDLIQAFIEAALVSGATAIHPGGARDLGVAGFAQAVLAAGLIWAGAPLAGLTPWSETVRRGDRALLWETAPPVAGQAAQPGVVGPDRLVEAVTGLDLVERQLRHAAGEPLDDVPAPSGHAIQAALYAGPQTLVPVAVRGWVVPEHDGVVIDAVLADGAWLTRHDDAVLARVTAHGRDRAQALDRLTAAVDGIAVTEPPAELAALRALLREPR